MSWGLTFNAEVYIPHTSSFDKNIYQVEDEIYDTDLEIENIEGLLKMLAMADPKSLISEEQEDVLYSLNNRIKELLQSLRELTIYRMKLSLYLETLKEDSDE